MKRISKIEKKYVLQCLNDQFRTSKGSYFTALVEKKIKDLYNVKHAISHSNGTATLHNAINSLGIDKDDEIIVPPLTMSSTAISVLMNNSIPVFADVDMDTFNISPNSILNAITPKTKAIMAVSLYGLSPDYDEILKICNKYNLFLIEDNAESFLSEYKGKLIGSFGNFSSFSFQSSKHLTCGEGGMLITNDDDLADRARRFSSLGYQGLKESSKITKSDIQNPSYDRHVSLGFNYRMSEIQSSILLGQIERSRKLVDRRIEVANLFMEAIDNCEFLKCQYVPDGYKNTWWTFSMILKTDSDIDWYRFREIFLNYGGDEYYAAWKLSYKEPLFLNMNDNRIWQKYNENICPNADYLQKKMIQLKTNYWNLKDAEKQVKILKKTIKKFK